jgi:hypothetical protein
MTQEDSKDTYTRPPGSWLDNAPEPLQTEADVLELDKMIEEEKAKRKRKEEPSK